MNDIAISIKDLSKRFRLGARQERYKTLRDTLMETFSRPFRMLKKSRSGTSNADAETIWALKDISFEIKRGESVGIIGRNGAGKSTLLKILSRITEPTTGYAEIFGRVGSLLEVGTGFHGELSGRDNIYLNGAILGMKRSEIDRKFDEIVSFAEVERFIDTPVKHYSSGMYLRLAFAVAAHLEPEILIVDEVLAVGDVQFQKKCLGKMEDVSKEGRTVLFVSHNMAAVQNLCTRTIVLHAGQKTCDTTSIEAIEYYLRSDVDNARSDTRQQRENALVVNDEVIDVSRFWVDQEGRDSQHIITSKPLRICILYSIKKEVSGLRIGFDLYSSDGCFVFRSFNDDMPEANLRYPGKPGTYHAEAIIPENFLNDQDYRIELAIGIHMIRWISRGEHILRFRTNRIGGANVVYADKRPGAILPGLNWSNKPA